MDRLSSSSVIKANNDFLYSDREGFVKQGLTWTEIGIANFIDGF